MSEAERLAEIDRLTRQQARESTWGYRADEERRAARTERHGERIAAAFHGAHAEPARPGPKPDASLRPTSRAAFQEALVRRAVQHLEGIRPGILDERLLDTLARLALAGQQLYRGGAVRGLLLAMRAHLEPRDGIRLVAASRIFAAWTFLAINDLPEGVILGTTTVAEAFEMRREYVGTTLRRLNGKDGTMRGESAESR